MKSASLNFEPSAVPTVSDADLMRRISAGDMESFATLIRRHQQRVHRLAYHITGAIDVADDITQESFLRVLRSAHNYRPSAAFTTFLHRIVVNLCLDRGKRPKLMAFREDPPGATVAPDDALSRDERITAIREAIAALPERQRIALLLHRFEGLNHEAISHATGWSESAVEALLVRAYARLRERLKRWEN